ncbi:DNA translocase FtsK [Proteus mirabilis]|uniref:DNA translocase FtsK n=1 Tax=Proteus mirabilis TaxID=584 RepID=UPI001319EC5C|nr:DNA translocase FtsK [Proteus mirabilis]MCU9570631.1 hypothetical protein [Proteus mirabilis]
MTAKAIDYVILINRASPRRLQRHFRIGFHRAERIINQLEYLGVITPLNQDDYREVLGYPTHYRPFDTSGFSTPIGTAQTPLFSELPLGTQSLEYRCLIQAIVWQRIVVWVEEIEIEGGTTNILKSVSPFEYLIDTHSDDIYQDTLRNNASSYRFLATLRPETPLDVLRQHGRISNQPCWKLPRIAQEEWQGLWVPNEAGWESLCEENIHQPRGIGEWPDLPNKSMKPLVHGLQEDGGDYLRYLIYWKSQI